MHTALSKAIVGIFMIVRAETCTPTSYSQGTVTSGRVAVTNYYTPTSTIISKGACGTGNALSGLAGYNSNCLSNSTDASCAVAVAGTGTGLQTGTGCYGSSAGWSGNNYGCGDASAPTAGNCSSGYSGSAGYSGNGCSTAAYYGGNAYTGGASTGTCQGQVQGNYGSAGCGSYTNNLGTANCYGASTTGTYGCDGLYAGTASSCGNLASYGSGSSYGSAMCNAAPVSCA
ncbi:hypothetical protein ENBRE01_0551 [Enteropsectra breve]|nr:hypothetical protein ENBRE01_0551 [Enteropsectra breve]